MNELKISKELEWFRPYLNKVKGIVPVHQLEKIIAGKPNIKNVQHFQAQLMTESNTRTGEVIRQYITINLYALRTVKLEPLKRVKEPYSKIDLLMNLAHELAHLFHGDHTPERQQLENRLGSLFMSQLLKTGYISEEHEFKTNKPKF